MSYSKKIFLFFFLFVTLLTIFPKISYANFSGGIGTELDPWLISTPADLNNLRNYLGSTHTGKYYKLTNDIDLNIAPYNTGTGWVPIGVLSMASRFYGQIDGDNHTIRNLYINSSSLLYAGLFGYLQDAEVKNLNFQNPTITGDRYVGTLVGGVYNAKFSNIHVSGLNLNSIGGYAGGVAGAVLIANGNAVAIANVSAEGVINSGASSVFTGGLIGRIEGNTITLSNCHANVDIVGGKQMGGAFGGAYSAAAPHNFTISNCSATGNINSIHIAGGSIGGFAGAADRTIFQDSYATGDILSLTTTRTGNLGNGGFVGYGGDSQYTRCYATGELDLLGYGMGGFVGTLDMSGSVSESFSIGTVKGGDRVAGFIGISLSPISNSYSRGEAISKINADSIAGFFSVGDIPISNSYSTGKPTTTHDWKYGFAGRPGAIPTCSNSFWDKETAEISTTVCDAVGKTTVEMKTQGTYTDWDFTSTWAIDPSLNGGYPYLQWAENYLAVTAPGTQASNISFSDIQSSQMTISWDKGDGDRRIVFGKQAATGTATPVDETTYTASSNFGSGSQIDDTDWYAVYKGFGSSVTIENLESGKDYIFQIFEYNGYSSVEKYFKETAIDNPAIQTTEVMIFTVTFKDWDGTTLKTEGVASGSGATPPADPTRIGHTFTGWDVDYSNVINNLTVTAQYLINQYTVTFDSAGGSTVNSITQNYGTAVSAPTNPTKTGYTFTGWDPVLPGTMPASSNTHTAQWTLNSYTITFNSAGGSAIEPITQNYGTAVSAPTNPTRTGYTFDEWSPELPTTMPASSATHTAQWTPNNYTITFNSQGGTAPSPEAKEVAFNSAYGTLPTVTKTGYTFNGWFTATDGGAEITSVSVLDTADHHTLYAQWTINQYAITFNSAGGTAIESIIQDYDTEVTVPAAPTRTGHTFQNWNTQADGEGTARNPSDTFDMPAENFTLYAIWEINQYTITFDSAGGSAVDPITQDYGTEVTAPTNPTKTGYTFTGWSPELPATMPASSNTHTAQWTINTYTLTYSIEGNGSILGETTQTVNHGDNASTVEAVADNGYYFVDWSDDSTDNPRTDTNVTDNISVTANFAQEEQEGDNQSNDGDNSSGVNHFKPIPIGDGTVDVAIPMNEAKPVGDIGAGGINAFMYINSRADFSALVSRTRSMENHGLRISEMDIAGKKIKIIIYSEPIFFDLSLGEKRQVDLDKDGVNDIEVSFVDLVVNRVEITIKELDFAKTAERKSEEAVGKTEALFPTLVITNQYLYSRIKGRIILRVEENGEAYYVHPVEQEMRYLGRPDDAFIIMRDQGIGITDEDLLKFRTSEEAGQVSSEEVSAFARKHKGKIFLQVERNGEAWYINPADSRRHYLGRPQDAFNIMKSLGLGISNADFEKL